MAAIDFTVTHDFAAPASVVWAEMTDWKKHESWIPATRIELDEPGSQGVDSTFTAYTGYGPVALVDRMRVSKSNWDEESLSGECQVEKLGPVLEGSAGFDVTPIGDGARVEWFERVEVAYLPRFLAPLVSKLSAQGFAFGMKRLAKVIADDLTTAS